MTAPCARPEGPAVDQRAVAEILDEFLRCTDVPGVAASLFASTGVVAQAGRGMSSIESPDVAMTPQTVGLVYSLTKVMTGTALGVLAARGRVDFDEPIARHLPDVGGRERFERTTLRHLLSHTAGLVHGPVPFSSAVSSPDPLEQYVLGACVGAPRLAEPGEVFSYSDNGIVVAGYVLQRVIEKPFAQAMHEVLFAPAGMARTTLDPLVAMTFPLSQQHVPSESGGLAVRRRFAVYPMTQPSSGAFGCAEDLARVGVVHLRGSPGGKSGPLLTAAVADELHAPVVDVGLDIVRDFGLAICIGPRYGEVLSVGHEGHYAGGWAKLQLIPDQGIGAAWLDNRGDDLALAPTRQDFFDRLLCLLGAGRRSWRRSDAGGHAAGEVDVRRAAGHYARPAGRPIEVTPGPHGLRATDGVTVVDYERLNGRIFVARGDTGALPARIPWAPDRDSTRSVLCVVGPAEAPTHILMNGLPFQRR
jgi:CubicO group peptidase (beta-lactamase class C family)